MTDRKATIVNVAPHHPRGAGGPSTVMVAMDTGLKSGKLTMGELSVDEALDLAESFLSAAIIVKGVNASKGVT